MKSVAIFRHFRTEGPGYFGEYLAQREIPWRLVALDEGAAVPDEATEFAGLVFMGGPMSVNDDLPWIAPVLDLIRGAVARGVPVLGHCLGGQLMSKALGGVVSRNAIKEIGWGEVRVADNAEAKAWFGAQLQRFTTFHWHGETFAIPPGTTPLLSSVWCQNQAFSLGPHLALQCHIEMTRPLVESWCDSGRREIERSGSPAVQGVAGILKDVDARVAALHAVADTVYARWVAGLRG